MAGFLALTRKIGESVVLGEAGMQIILTSGEMITLTEPIEVKFSKRFGTEQSQLCFRAPRGVRILRKELHDEEKLRG